MKHRRQLLGAMAAGALAGPLDALLGAETRAQASGNAAGFPSKPIAMVVPACRQATGPWVGLTTQLAP